MKQRLDITDECKADARRRLLDHLDGVRVWNTPFVDGKQVLEDWIAEERAKWIAVCRRAADAIQEHSDTVWLNECPVGVHETVYEMLLAAIEDAKGKVT